MKTYATRPWAPMTLLSKSLQSIVSPLVGQQPVVLKARLDRNRADILQFGQRSAKEALQEKIERLSPPNTALTWTTEDGKKLNFRYWGNDSGAAHKKGEKRPVILILHGMDSQSLWMGPMVEALMKTDIAAHACIYAMDIPDYGYQPEKTKNMRSISALNDDVRTLIKMLGAHHQDKVYPIGISLGGLLLGNVSADNPPDALAAASLITPALKAHPRLVGHRAIVRAVLAPFRRVLKRQQRASGRKDENQEGLTELQRALIEYWYTCAKPGKYTLASRYRILRGMANFQKSLASQLKRPVQVFVSNTDQWVDTPAVQKAFARFPTPQKELVTLLDGKHNLVLDPQIGQIAQGISRFILRQR